jgi:hypothetical protein
MKVLEILKSPADETVKKIIHVHSQGNEVEVFKLYEGVPDYDALIDKIFDYEKVICWW